jgi:hypothetical protein
MTAGDPETRLRWRRLRFEPLEDRRLLAADSALSHWLPGLQLVDQDSSLSATSVLSGTIGHEASQSWETVAGLQTPSSLASFAYSGDVYWSGQPRKSPFHRDSFLWGRTFLHDHTGKRTQSSTDWRI